MKNRRRMNSKRLMAIAAGLLALSLAAPISAAAAQEGDMPSNQMQVEYRYAEGEAPDIPATVDVGGRTYRLVSQTSPVLESSMPAVRTYSWRVDGALTPEQLEMIKGLGDITLTPVNIVKERETDKETTLPMATNDVDDVPEYMDFEVTSGTAASGHETKSLKRAGVTFEIAGKESGTRSDLPAGYIATVLYRGVETYAEPGYYTATATFTTSESDGEDNTYIVTATYETDIPEAAIVPPIDDTQEPIAEVVEPEAALPVTNISDEDVAKIAGQGPNLLQNLADGLVPLGSIFATGVWSLLSGIMSIAAIVIAVVTAAGAALRRRHAKALSELGEYEEAQGKRRRRGILLLVLTIVAAVLTLNTWLILDDFSFGMTWLSASTVPVGILLACTIIFSALGNAREQRRLKADLDEVETYVGAGQPGVA